MGGGGRYDGLVEALGGPPTPGIGFGAGVERIVLAIQGETARSPRGSTATWWCPTRGCASTRWPCSSGCATKACVESDLRGRSMKGMMRHAASLGRAQAR